MPGMTALTGEENFSESSLWTSNQREVAIVTMVAVVSGVLLRDSASLLGEHCHRQRRFVYLFHMGTEQRPLRIPDLLDDYVHAMIALLPRHEAAVSPEVRPLTLLREPMSACVKRIKSRKSCKINTGRETIISGDV